MFSQELLEYEDEGLSDEEEAFIRNRVKAIEERTRKLRETYFTIHQKRLKELHGDDFEAIALEEKEPPVKFLRNIVGGKSQRNVWFHGDIVRIYGGDWAVEDIATIVYKFIRKFPRRRDMVFSMTWSSWDEDVDGEFFGGSVVVSRLGRIVKTSHEVSRELADSFKERLLKEKITKTMQEVYAASGPTLEAREIHVVWREGSGEWKAKPIISPPTMAESQLAGTAAAIGTAIVFGGSSGAV
jgi:hypothetical protein